MSLRIRSAIHRLRAPALTFTLPATLAMGLLLGAPIAYVAWLSLHKWHGSQSNPWEWVGLRNYAFAIARDAEFQRSAWNTVVFSFAVVVLTLLIGLAIALLINRPFRGRNAVVALLLIPVVSTPVAVASTWKQMLQYEATLNALVGAVGIEPQAWLGNDLAMATMIFVDTTRWSPLVALILLAGLTALPSEPYEAAKIDGAGPVQLFRYLTLPFLRPFIAIAALLRTIDAIKTFDEIQVITAGGPAGGTQTTYLYAYKVGFTYLNFGDVSAILVLMFAAIVVASLLIIRARHQR